MTKDTTSRKQKFISRLKELKNDEYELIGDYTTVRTKTVFKHKLCGYEWETVPHNLMNAKGTLGCPNCQYRKKSKTTSQFKKELHTKCGNEYSLVEGQKYINNRVKLLFTHNTCGTTFLLTPTSIFVNTISCPTCLSKNPKSKKKTTEKFKDELREKRGNSYELVEGHEYISALEKVKIRHTSCGYEWDVRASHILHTSGCPSCNESKGENKIKNILLSLGVTYEREYIFKDLKNTKYLPFDFAIIDVDSIVGLIEYDGSQHFIPFKHFGGEDKLKKTQFNDAKKDSYCSSKGIPLKRIKYTLTDSEINKEITTFIKTIIKK